ncbi:MAG: hypothetical protein SGBAC_009031, partial [Bacillariaceae sp.]
MSYKVVIIINTTYAILLPMVAALMIPPTPTTGILSKVKPSSVTSLNFHNPSMGRLDSQGHYKARDSPISSVGNRFRTVPKPYYESAFQHQPVAPMRTSAAARSSSSEYSDYGTQEVYWTDVNGFPQDVVDPAAIPSMDDMRNDMGGGRMNADEHVYSPDKYYPHQEHSNPGSSSSNFEDIPFRSNENYSRKFQRHAQGEGLGNMKNGGGNMHGGMNGEFDQRPMDRPYSHDMMGQGGGYGGGPGGPGGGMGAYYGHNHNGMQDDFPSLMNEIMPPSGGMGMMGDPYSPYGQHHRQQQQQGYGGEYGGHPYGMTEQPGMMMGVGMDMHHHGDFGFHGGMGGMGGIRPGGCEEFGGPHGP